MNTKRTAIALSGLLVTMIMAGCASTRVRTDYDRQHSFADLATYGWSEAETARGENPALYSPLLERRVQTAVDHQLAELGYARSGHETPDFRVSYQIIGDQKLHVSASAPYYGFGFGYGSYRYGRRFHPYAFNGFSAYPGYGFGTGNFRSYLEGTLVLDVVDADTDRLIWRGWATADLDDDPEPEEVEAFVNEAVAKILERFPVAQPTDETPQRDGGLVTMSEN